MSNQDYYGAGRQVYGDGGPQPLHQVYGQQYGGSPYPPQQSPYPPPGGDYQGGYNTTPHQPGYDQGPPPSHSPYPAPYNEHQRAHSPFPPQGQVEVYGGNQNGGYGAPGPPGDYGVPGDSSGPQDGERGFLGNTVGAAAGGYTGHKLCGGPLGTIGGIIAGVVGANLLDKACDKKKKDKHYCSRCGLCHAPNSPCQGGGSTQGGWWRRCSRCGSCHEPNSPCHGGGSSHDDSVHHGSSYLSTGTLGVYAGGSHSGSHHGHHKKKQHHSRSRSKGGGSSSSSGSDSD